jgi:hypothetical protein
MKKKSGKFSLVIFAAVLGVACVQFGFAQTFKNVPGAPNFRQVSAGGQSVWALANSGGLSFYETGSGDGGWVFNESATHFIQIAPGGGNLFQSQPDAVWALDASHNIYTLTASGFVQVSDALGQIAVGPGYQDSCHPYEVWGISLTSQVFRYDYCSGQFNQEPGTLARIAVGGAGVWGLTSKRPDLRAGFCNAHTQPSSWKAQPDRGWPQRSLGNRCLA